MKLVVVESPAKAKTLEKYIGKDAKVLASFGHVRDLVPKSGSVNPEEDFKMAWEVLDKPQSRKAIEQILKDLKKAEVLVLATDPDREGEAISWHLLEILKEAGALNGTRVERVCFNAVTKSAVLEAMKAPRAIDEHLVQAYLARLSLDYLVGFTLSPILWRKLPGSRSAGRVQSVALRIVVEREQEIEAFKIEEYWSIEGLFRTQDKTFKGRLTAVQGKVLEKMSLPNESAARQAVDMAKVPPFFVKELKRKQVQRHPAAPFTTSTLQQEASRKLGFSPARTMQLAQRLYEGVDRGDGETMGLITYMRTDSVQIVPEAVQDIRRHVGELFSETYVPQAPRAYKSKAKNAQEAHEAIRPTDLALHPDRLSHLEPALQKLYALIWRRTMASQMASAIFDQTSVEIEGAQALFRATGRVLQFDGFLKLYAESVDEPEEDEGGASLPRLEEGQSLELEDIIPSQHFTQPPPRYSEASLVKKMEELGIGRPSTYARILQVLQERGYVALENRQLIPQERGRVVTAFLKHFFARYVAHEFTARMEEELDEVSEGLRYWKEVLTLFWKDFNGAVHQAKDLKIQEVLEALQKDMSPHLFRTEAQARCPLCGKEPLSLRMGKHGPFLGCPAYPECTYTRPLQQETLEEGNVAFPRTLGVHPETGEPLSVRLGPFGPYLQVGDGETPRRVRLGREVNAETLTLEGALGLCQFPREIGLHPETQKPLMVGQGRFGPYVKHEGAYYSLRKGKDPLTLTLAEALEVIAQKESRPPSKRPRKSSARPKKGK